MIKSILLAFAMIAFLTSDSKAIQVVKHYHIYQAPECGSAKNVNDCRVIGNNNTFRDINCIISEEKKKP